MRETGLDPREVARYGRHLTLPEVGVEGQLRMRKARVLLVGAGGLGSPLAMYLGAAGVGTIGICEFDTVDVSNLQRQVLYGTDDVGHPKLERAAARIRELNPHVEVVPHALRLAAENAADIVGAYDLVVDGSDNFATRYLVNDACVLSGKPLVYGSIFRFEGQVSVFHPPSGPCYRCLYPEPPQPGAVPNCAEGGVLGVLPGIVGTIQATEALKLILGLGESLLGRLLLVDAAEMRFREVKLRRSPDCPVCGDAPTIRNLQDTAAGCAVTENASTMQSGDRPHEIDVLSLQARLRSDDAAGTRPPVLLDVRTEAEWQICRLEGADLLPIQQLAARHDELDRDRDIVVYCHVGGRSAMAVQFLLERGFERVWNLVGGIDAWSVHVEPGMARY